MAADLTVVKGERCSERVYPGGSFRGSQCKNLAVVRRERRSERREPVLSAPEGWEGVSLKTGEYTTREEVTVHAYCATHDPVAKAEREARKRQQETAAWERRRAQEKETEARTAANYTEVKALCERLGVGQPLRDVSPYSDRSMYRKVVLTETEVLALLNRLEEAEAHVQLHEAEAQHARLNARGGTADENAQ